MIYLGKNLPGNSEYEMKQRNMLKIGYNFSIDGLSIIDFKEIFEFLLTHYII